MREEIFVGRSELCFGVCLRSVDARARISLNVVRSLFDIFVFNLRENVKENIKILDSGNEPVSEQGVQTAKNRNSVN